MYHWATKLDHTKALSPKPLLCGQESSNCTKVQGARLNPQTRNPNPKPLPPAQLSSIFVGDYEVEPRLPKKPRRKREGLCPKIPCTWV